MCVKTLARIRALLGETKYRIAKERFKRSYQAYDALEQTGKTLAVEDVPIVRAMAHDAGWSDTELLDSLCKDAKEIVRTGQGRPVIKRSKG